MVCSRSDRHRLNLKARLRVRPWRCRQYIRVRVAAFSICEQGLFAQRQVATLANMKATVPPKLAEMRANSTLLPAPSQHALPGLALPPGKHLDDLTDKENVEKDVETLYVEVSEQFADGPECMRGWLRAAPLG